MTRMSRFTVLLASVLLGLNEATAAPPSTDSLTSEFMQLSGLDYQLQQIPEQVLMGFEQQGRRLPSERRAALRHVIAQAYRADRLKAFVSRELARTARPDVLTKSLAWLRSDLGRRITKLEEAASEPSAVREVQQFARQLQSSPPPQERLRLAERLDRATNSTETQLDLMESTMLGVATAADATLPPQQRLGEERIRTQIARQRAALHTAAQQQVLLSSLFMYRSVSPAELEQYLAFLESEAGKEMYSATNHAFKGALKAAIHRMSRSMMDAIKPPAGRAGT